MQFIAICIREHVFCVFINNALRKSVVKASLGFHESALAHFGICTVSYTLSKLCMQIVLYIQAYFYTTHLFTGMI